MATGGSGWDGVGREGTVKCDCVDMGKHCLQITVVIPIVSDSMQS
jgi:hypothetical protein